MTMTTTQGPAERRSWRDLLASSWRQNIIYLGFVGLTVPFALAAGLSGAIASSGIVVTAGLAEVAAGSICDGTGRLSGGARRRGSHLADTD